MEEFETPNLIASFLHMEDNQDGTCTMTICMDGINIVTSLIEMTMRDYYKAIIGENGEYADHAYEVAMQMHESGKVTEIPSHIGDS